MPARRDFLRQIVNRILATANVPHQVADEIKRQIGKAEEKYKFQAHGGDLRGLAAYLQSSEFKNLVQFVKSTSNDAVELLRKILVEAMNAYSDIDEVRQAIERTLQELEAPSTTGEKTVATITSIDEVLRSLEERLKREKLSFTISRSDSKIIVGDKGLEASISLDNERRGFHVVYTVRGEHETKSLEELVNFLKQLNKLLKS